MHKKNAFTPKSQPAQLRSPWIARYTSLMCAFMFAASGAAQDVSQDAITTLNAPVAQLSEEERNTLYTANLQAAGELSRLISSFENAYGPISQSRLAENNYYSKGDYVIDQVLCWGSDNLTASEVSKSTNLRTTLPRMPFNAFPVVSEFEKYLNALGPATSLLDKKSSSRVCQ